VPYKQNIEENEIKFNPISNSNILDIGLNLKPEDMSDHIYTFYLVRHGDGIHNKAKADGKKGIFGPNLIDAELTLDGKSQAIEAGNKLKSLLGHTPIDYLFASDLKRTRQTLEGVLGQGILLSNPKSNVIILPCSHELDYKKNSCDGNQPNIFSAENKTSCNTTNVICDSTGKKIDYCSSIIKSPSE